MFTVIVKYASSPRQIQVTEQKTLREIISDVDNKAYLGYGDNVDVMVNYESVRNLDVVPPNNSVVIINNKAADKAADMFTLKYASSPRALQLPVDGRSINSVTNEADNKAYLGYGDNVEYMANYETVSGSYVPKANDVVIINNKAADKA